MENPYLHYSNLIGIPTQIFASIEFNENPRPTHINGVREMYRPFFEVLNRLEEKDFAPLFFEHMRALYNLEDQELQGKSKKYRAGFMRLIKGWFFDSNRPEGAVMKGWVESRFGLRALYHNGILTGLNTPEYMSYLAEKMHPRFHYNSIYSQLDLVYEYVQEYLKRFGPADGMLTLYRGYNSAADESERVKTIGPRSWVLRNNCLTSYSADIERASEFGDRIVRIRVPFQKVFCYEKALGGKFPGYEKEHILLGGDYLSEEVDFF